MQYFSLFFYPFSVELIIELRFYIFIMRVILKSGQYGIGGETLKIRLVVLALGLILLSAAGLCGCGGDRELTKITANDKIPELQKLRPIDESSSPDVPLENDGSAAIELTALADTREEAEKIAELYGIELSSYSYGVATYTTEKSLKELMNLGLENNYPELTPNYEQELFTEQ